MLLPIENEEKAERALPTRPVRLRLRWSLDGRQGESSGSSSQPWTGAISGSIDVPALSDGVDTISGAVEGPEVSAVWAEVDAAEGV